MALWATVIGYFRIFSPTIRTFLVCTNVNLPIFRIFPVSLSHNLDIFLRNGKILIFFSLCLISRTNFSYPLQYPLRKVDSFVDPKRLLRATFPIFPLVQVSQVMDSPSLIVAFLWQRHLNRYWFVPSILI